MRFFWLSHDCQRLTGPADPQAAGAAEGLRKFDYPPVGAVSISYPLSAIREDRKDATGQLPGGHVASLGSGDKASHPSCFRVHSSCSAWQSLNSRSSLTSLAGGLSVTSVVCREEVLHVGDLRFGTCVTPRREQHLNSDDV